MADDDRYLTGGGELIPEQRSASYSTNTSFGPLSGGAILAGQDEGVPMYGGRLTAQLPEGLSATLSRTNQAGETAAYARDAIRLAKQLEAGQLALEASRIGSQGLPSYGLQYSGQIGREGGAPSYYPQPKGHWFVEAGGTPHTPERHVRGGARFNFADGGTVEDALHAVRHHLAGGGFLSDLFSGPDYLSTGKEASFANMPTQDETTADFFKADRALRLAREVQANADDVTGSVPARAPLTAPRPGKVEVQDLPVKIPFAAPERGVSMLSSDISPASVTSLPLAYTATPVAAPAAAAIDQATNKLTARVDPNSDAERASNVWNRMLIQESGGRQFDRYGNTITSPAGALGISQVMPSTGPEAAALAGLPWSLERLRTDPEYNHALGRAYYEAQLERFGDPILAAAAYNGGPGRVAGALRQARETGLPWTTFLRPETQNYVRVVGRAEGGEIDGDDAMRDDFDKGGVVKKAMRVIQNYQDPAANKIADWKWRPLADVDAELSLTEIPPHVQAFGDYMRGMADKAAGPGLTARDLIKGYTTTRASIQRRATDADRLRQLGLDLPDEVKKIRPEGAWAEWLGTPMGKRYLDAAARGDVEGDAVANAIKIMSPFGRHETDIPDSMKWAAQNLPGRETTVSDLVYRAAQGSSTPDEWRNFTAGIKGVGPSKSGFLASMYGRGDQPTLDARQIILNTGEPTKNAKPFLARDKGEGGVEAVERLAARQSALGLEVPSKYDPFYQHLAHHSIWDKASNEMTTHSDVVKAMQEYAHGGSVDDALRVVREHHADGEAVGPTAQQRLRETIASIDPERAKDQPVMDPATMGEAWDRARRNYQNFPVQEGEAVARPLELGARDVIGGAIAGGAREPGAQFRRGVADLLVGSTGLPNSGTLGFGVADAPMITGIPLTLADMAHDIGQGDYTSTAMGAALPAAFYARGPLGAAGRRAVEIAREYAKPAAAAATGVAGATVAPDEAEAAKLSKLLRSGETVLGAGPVRKTAQDEVSGLFDYSRLHEVPKVTQFDLPRVIPPRGVPERVTDLMANKDVRDKMAEVILEGQRMGGANWYNTDPLLEKFVEQLGPDAGQKAYRKYMDFVAATSPRSDVGTNVRNASYYYGRDMRGEGMPAVGDRNPQPFGHMAQRLHQMNAERVAGPGWDPLNNPKPASFVENLAGNQEPVTVDTHAFRLPAILAKDPRFLETAYQASKDAPKLNIQKLVMSGDMSMEDALKTPAYWQAQPKANEYGAMEQYYKPIGRELGMTPAQTQASAWVGGGKLTGLASDESKPFLRFFDDRIMKTARETGMDPKDVLRDFISGKAPLYNKGGSVEDRALMLVSRQA